MTDQELEQHSKIGTLFCLNTVMEYTEVLNVYLEDKTDDLSKYQYKESKKVNKSCRILFKSLYRGLTKGAPAENETLIKDAILKHTTLVTDFFILNETDQKRVSGLINKIKKEKCNGKVGNRIS